MMSASPLPFSGPESDLLFVEISEELFRLEEDLARFHELGAARRFGSPDAYMQQIRIRCELLYLLGATL